MPESPGSRRGLRAVRANRQWLGFSPLLEPLSGSGATGVPFLIINVVAIRLAGISSWTVIGCVASFFSANGIMTDQDGKKCFRWLSSVNSSVSFWKHCLRTSPPASSPLTAYLFPFCRPALCERTKKVSCLSLTSFVLSLCSQALAVSVQTLPSFFRPRGQRHQPDALALQRKPADSGRKGDILH